MPKVTEEYLIKKREEIIDAAFMIFMEKPLYEMTMLDVIKQAGLSKGGIYRYFSDIDDVLIELINRESRKNNYRSKIESTLLQSDSNKSAIEGLIKLLGRHIGESSSTVGKIQFELTVLGANHPDRAKKITSQLTEQENGQYLIESLFQRIIDGLNKGEFVSTYSYEEIFDYIKVYGEGLVKTVVLERCYGEKKSNLSPELMMDMLSKNVLDMLSNKC